ncbi:unnamed protein product, partial [marine sediment metagenome]
MIETIDKQHLIEDLQALGIIQGEVLYTKVSMSSIGYVVGGAKTLIDALLEVVGPAGTIITNAFITGYPIPLSQKNAQKISDRYTSSYAGAFANAMVYHPDAVCSTHPIQRFVAIGAYAKELMASHTPESPAYDVLRILAQSAGGQNLKIGTDAKVVGVGTTHVAQELLGFQKNNPRLGVNYYDYETKQIKTFERNWSGGCGVGFNNFIPFYRDAGAIKSEGRVGNADSKITDMRETLEIELEMLSKEPRLFLCNQPTCKDCRLSWDFSDGSVLSYKF